MAHITLWTSVYFIQDTTNVLNWTVNWRICGFEVHTAEIQMQMYVLVCFRALTSRKYYKHLLAYVKKLDSCMQINQFEWLLTSENNYNYYFCLLAIIPKIITKIINEEVFDSFTTELTEDNLNVHSPYILFHCTSTL